MPTSLRDKTEIQKDFMLVLWFQAVFAASSSPVALWGRKAGSEGEPFHWASACFLRFLLPSSGVGAESTSSS